MATGIDRHASPLGGRNDDTVDGHLEPRQRRHIRRHLDLQPADVGQQGIGTLLRVLLAGHQVVYLGRVALVRCQRPRGRGDRTVIAPSGGDASILLVALSQAELRGHARLDPLALLELGARLLVMPGLHQRHRFLKRAVGRFHIGPLAMGRGSDAQHHRQRQR